MKKVLLSAAVSGVAFYLARGNTLGIPEAMGLLKLTDAEKATSSIGEALRRKSTQVGVGAAVIAGIVAWRLQK